MAPDYMTIYLQPECCAGDEGRLWCPDNIAECDEGVPWTEYTNAQNSTSWVSVKTRLPEESGIYIAGSSDPDRLPTTDLLDCIYRYNKEAKAGESKWQHSSGFYDNGITHWMEKPKPPVEDKS
ncbi:MAG: DUF551 domain-containing protein [Helicobacteraceae bacterium]|nr:DUF551 domain-containing protein [Helicobacteraceae bacterium]